MFLKQIKKIGALSLGAILREAFIRSNNIVDEISGNFPATVSSAPSLAPLLELETWSGRLP